MKTEGSIKSRYQTGQSPRRKRKDKQGIWASHLEMNRNQHCLHPYVAVWPVVGNLSYHHNHLPGSHYWSVNSGTRSWNKRLTPTFQLPMFYQPASHAFAPRILSVHFPYPILSLTHILNWISIQVLILLSCACLPSCPMLKSVLLLPRCVVFALLLWWANPLVPIITPLCAGEVESTFLPWEGWDILSILSLYPGGPFQVPHVARKRPAFFLSFIFLSCFTVQQPTLFLVKIA